MHSIELKYATLIYRPITVLYIVSILVKLGLILFYRGIKMNFYLLQSMESNYMKYVSVWKVFPIKFKSGMCILDHRVLCYINFYVHRRYSLFFYRIHKVSYIKVYCLKLFEVHFSIVKLLNYFEYVFGKSSRVTPDFFNISLYLYSTK